LRDLAGLVDGGAGDGEEPRPRASVPPPEDGPAVLDAKHPEAT
jgi:hypothetical protein